VGFARHYFWARGTHVVAASTNNNDRQSDISVPLLLPSIIAMGSMTSVDHCYYGARGTHTVADSAYNSDESYNISESLLLWGT
jgi:hypothetical protein